MRDLRPPYRYDAIDAESFAHGLNEAKKSKSNRYAEMVRIVRDLNDLAAGRAISHNLFRDQKHKRQIERHFGKKYSLVIDEDIFASDPKDVPKLAIARLNHRLEKYTYRAEINEGLRENELCIEWKRGSPGSPAVYLVLRLAESGLLARVRQCERCGDWFFAKRSIARFCKKTCAKLHWNASEAGRSERRKYMRTYMQKYRKGK
jgi:hypothetical protein